MKINSQVVTVQVKGDTWNQFQAENPWDSLIEGADPCAHRYKARRRGWVRKKGGFVGSLYNGNMTIISVLLP